jgi:hypothetical protein
MLFAEPTGKSVTGVLAPESALKTFLTVPSPPATTTSSASSLSAFSQRSSLIDW